MPSLKCCRTGDSSGDDDEGSRNHKRIKENNKNEGVLPAASARRSRRRCNSVQWDGEEAKSKMKESSNRVQEVINARSLRVRTSRGRVQARSRNSERKSWEAFGLCYDPGSYHCVAPFTSHHRNLRMQV
nr:histone-lysine N-methyltransferase ATX4-like [Ipomoea batatas]